MNILTYRNFSILVFFTGLIVFFFDIFFRHYPIRSSLFRIEEILLFSLLLVLVTSIFLTIFPLGKKFKECNSVFYLYIFTSSVYLLLLFGVKTILNDPFLFDKFVNLSFLNFQALGFALVVIGLFAFWKYRLYMKLAQNDEVVGQEMSPEKNHPRN